MNTELIQYIIGWVVVLIAVAGTLLNIGIVYSLVSAVRETLRVRDRVAAVSLTMASKWGYTQVLRDVSRRHVKF